MKDHCAYPKCGKELTHVPGRKKKKYCNQTCNTRHWQMMNPAHKPKHKLIPLDEYKELTELKIQNANKQTNVIKPQEPLGSPKTNFVINTTEPKENTMAFFNKYGCNTWAEVNQNKNN